MGVYTGHERLKMQFFPIMQCVGFVRKSDGNQTRTVEIPSISVYSSTPICFSCIEFVHRQTFACVGMYVHFGPIRYAGEDKCVDEISHIHLPVYLKAQSLLL